MTLRGTDPVDSLVVDVRANTQGFAADMAAMRGSLEGGLLDGLGKAGEVLERGLIGAIRKGSLGFEDLRRIALGVLDQIAARAIDSLFSGSGGGAGGGLLGLGNLFGSILGLPGRATGGPVSPGRGYVVGENGPELFVPTSAGRVEAALPASRARDVRVAITIAAPPGMSAPQALQRSGRQVASAVRRALSAY